MPETVMAVMENEIRHLAAAVQSLERSSDTRRQEQDIQFKELSLEVSKLRLELESGRGFAKGIRWTFATLWIILGGAIASVFTKLFSGGS